MSGGGKPVLVTGGAGFLGRHLCKRLLGDGKEVLCLDNLSTGSRRNVAEFEGDSRFRIVEGDVAEPYDFDVEAIYNLACPASPPHYQERPVETLKTNVLGALHALELADRTGCRVLQASTSEVYGDPDVHPQPEEYRGSVNPIGPRACYDEGKRAAEALFFDFHRTRRTRIKVARIFNTYGPYMDPTDGRVVSNFIVQALQGRELTVYGDGLQTRSFCYVDDLIEGLVRMMNSPDEVVGPVNLGNPAELTVMELAKLVAARTGQEVRTEHRPLPVDDPRQRQPVIEKARTLLGWEPKVEPAEGIDQTIAFFKEALRKVPS